MGPQPMMMGPPPIMDTKLICSHFCIHHWWWSHHHGLWAHRTHHHGLLWAHHAHGHHGLPIGLHAHTLSHFHSACVHKASVPHFDLTQLVLRIHSAIGTLQG